VADDDHLSARTDAHSNRLTGADAHSNRLAGADRESDVIALTDALQTDAYEVAFTE
jgi:hypothetical protein